MLAKKTTYLILVILGLCFVIEASAQSRLYPKGRNNSKNSLTAYAARVDSLLLNNRKLNSFAFTIRPSFTGELGCYYENSELVLRIANKCIWYSKNIEINEYRCKISDEAANSINQLFFAAIFSSSYLAQPDGLDGETYELLVNGGYYTAECWSPKKNTNCKREVPCQRSPSQKYCFSITAAKAAPTTAGIRANTRPLTRLVRSQPSLLMGIACRPLHRRLSNRSPNRQAATISA